MNKEFAEVLAFIHGEETHEGPCPRSEVEIRGAWDSFCRAVAGLNKAGKLLKGVEVCQPREIHPRRYIGYFVGFYSRYLWGEKEDFLWEESHCTDNLPDWD